MFYVIKDLNGRRVYLNGIEMSPLLCGNEVSGNPYEPDQSMKHRSHLASFFTVSFDINPRFF